LAYTIFPKLNGFLYFTGDKTPNKVVTNKIVSYRRYGLSERAVIKKGTASAIKSAVRSLKMSSW
jgi:hypothetical protein